MPINRLILACVLLASTAGCFTTHGDDGPLACSAADSSYLIDNGGSFAYTPGVDAGYYITYVGAGEWHLEWTCDTSLSAAGCNFTGSIVADTPSQGPNATCVDCEANDDLTFAATTRGPAGEAQQEIDFNTITTTGIDGVDFFAVPGTTITLDIQVNGLDQPDIIYFLSGGASSAPGCVPFELTPPA